MKRKKLSLSVNRDVEAGPVPSPHTDRYPIVETSDAPSGLYEIKVRDSEGNRIGFLQISAPDFDDELLEDLKAWQARHAHGFPIPKLEVKS